MTDLQSPSLARSTAVARTAVGWTLISRLDRQIGDVLFRFEGEPRPVPSRDSVQIGEDRHLDLPAGVTFAERLEHFAWCFLNHHCDPNTRVVGQDLVALRPIRVGDELFFDYTCNEYEMAEAFDCRCGAEACLGRVQGFARLSDLDRRQRWNLASPHLRAHTARSRAADRRA